MTNILNNKFVVGKFIKFNGTVPSNSGSYCIAKKTVVSDGASPTPNFSVVLTIRETLTDFSLGTATIIQKDRFVDELGAMNTSSLCKYITRRMLLQKEATALKIFFGAYYPQDSNISVYYKLMKTHETRDFDDIEYRLAELDNLPAYSTNTNDMKDFEALVNGLDPFIAVSVKIVLQGTNTSDVPKVVDFRCIALDA